MDKPFLSKPRANLLASALFLIGLALIAYFDFWWPGIMAVLAISIPIRQLFIKHFYDALISFVVFGGIFVTVFWHFSWLPALFILGAIYLLFKFFLNEKEDEVEEEEEVQKEIEEETQAKE